VDGAATAGPAGVIAVPGGSAPGEITSTGSAEGHTHLHFALLPDAQEGDLIHILANERVVATALITGIDAMSATALVTGLTDRTRSVAVGDVAVLLAPEEVLPANVAPATPATVAPVAVAEVAPLPSEHSPSKAASVSVVAATEASITSAPTTAAIAASIPASTSAQITAPVPAPLIESLTPEVRARLTAERAYFELATRVLRLPDAGPELTELQTRLRSELAALELLP